MRKKSIRGSAQRFENATEEVLAFVAQKDLTGLSKKHVSWIYDLAIIMLYREFETLILDCLIALLNGDSQTLTTKTSIEFPKHMNVAVCEYLIVGEGFFDFRGRDGLIATVKKFLPDNHWFVKIIKEKKYRISLEQLSALRNYAAHDSSVSKKKALDALGLERISSAGSWLKVQGRLEKIATKLKSLANDINVAAAF